MSVRPPRRTSCDHSIYFKHRYEWILLGAVILTLSVMMAGCSTPVPVPKLVYAHDNTKALKAYEKGVKKVLKTPCPATIPNAAIATVNDLSAANDQNRGASNCRQSNIDQALKVKAPPPAT